MLSFVIVFTLAVLFLALSVMIEMEFDAISFVSELLGWVLVGILAIMGIIVIYNNIGIEGKIASCHQRYESLTYQLENNLYDNDNDLGKKELYDQIQAWNEDLAEGKAMQHDIWVGAFYPNIYDEFDFIELE